jgi:hypothetical protein
MVTKAETTLSCTHSNRLEPLTKPCRHMSRSNPGSPILERMTNSLSLDAFPWQCLQHQRSDYLPVDQQDRAPSSKKRVRTPGKPKDHESPALTLSLAASLRWALTTIPGGLIFKLWSSTIPISSWGQRLKTPLSASHCKQSPMWAILAATKGRTSKYLRKLLRQLKSSTAQESSDES